MSCFIITIKVAIESDNEENYKRAIATKLKIDEIFITIAEILSKALDFRDQKQFYYKLTIAADLPENFKNYQNLDLYLPPVSHSYSKSQSKERPIVIGFGPAGMFAALELIAHGLRPIVFERGQMIEQRSADVQSFIRKRKLNPESNIQYGEGGAGSFSDGKLFSRRNNNTSYVSRVLETFIKFGAPKEIGYIAKPHLGTDVLCKIVKNIRNYILDHGGDIHYGAKLSDILIKNEEAIGITINGEDEYYSKQIYLALGHSARDTYKVLYERGVFLEQKQISMGLRIEHPTETIDLMRYGQKYHKCDELGSATYSLNYTNKMIKSGVYTFCMCPGGEIVNASSEEGMLVVNGMSYSHRSSPFSNAALVVPCPVEMYNSKNPLSGLEFQKEIERKTFVAGGEGWRVPAQKLVDFLSNKSGNPIPETSFKMGTSLSDMNDIMPSHIIKLFHEAFQQWKEDVPLFISHNAVLIGSETRTSSPVKISRDEKYQSVSIKNLYPLGEGSGYTGGITSSAADAIRAVDVHFGSK